jgi:erythromycin esterase
MKQIFTFCLILSAVTGKTQDFYNLDFEYEAEMNQPRKWFVEEEGEKSSAALTGTEFHSGRRSLEVSVTNGQVVIYLSLPGEMIAGKTLRAEMHMKFSDGDSLQVMLGMKDPIGSRQSIFPVAKAPKDTWVLAQAEKAFSSYSSDRLLLAIIVVGKGKLFLDDVRLVSDGRNVIDGTPEFKEPDQKTLEIIHSKTVEIAPENKHGLTAFGKIVGESRVVALGENSHGSSSIYKLKLELIRFLITEKRFTLFALESPTVEADQINDYVMGAELSRADILKNLVYPAWKTQEMLDIINWIRSHNQKKNSTKVQFRGFDVQGGQSELNEISRLCKLYRPTLITTVDSIEHLFNKGGAFELQVKLLEKLQNSLDSSFSGSNSDEQMLRLNRYIHSLRQYCNTKIPNAMVDRDRGMAEIVKLLLNQGNEKIIISGDNTHITKSRGKMGSYLHDAISANYLPIGFTFGTGTYSAYGSNNPYKVHAPYIGTCEYLFNKTRLQVFALDLRLNALNFMSTSDLGFRSIGSRPQESTQFAEIKLQSHFDAIVYIQKSTHTTFPIE